MRIPLRPQIGIRAAGVFAEQLVKGMQARRLMQISKRESGNTQGIVRRGNSHRDLEGTDKFKVHGRRQRVKRSFKFATDLVRVESNLLEERPHRPGMG